jgi:tRNA (guanine-N7-)-methyltransferase
MSFGLGHGRTLDDAPGVIGITREELPSLPDEIIANPEAGRIDPRGWFQHPERELHLEIGCGKGGFILQEAATNPATNYLGIEYAREFYLYTADRLRRRGLENVRMLHTDASDFLRWRCPASVIRVIHLYFSDPWPKAKHHKNRVVQHRFLADAWRVLTQDGELRVVTDHDELWAWDEAHFAHWTTANDPAIAEWRKTGMMAAQPFERLAFMPPTWAEEGETVGTNYERKMCDGRPPHACVLRKAARAE